MDDVPVNPLFVGPDFQTGVWVSAAVATAIEKHLKRSGADADRYVDKVESYAKNGFKRFEGDKKGIRSKWDGIYAIQPFGLFRLFGFYDKDDFIVVTSTAKRGQKMGREDRAKVNKAALIRSSGAWFREYTE